MPFGQGQRTTYFRLAALYTAGGLLGAAATGFLAGLFGRLFAMGAPSTLVFLEPSDVTSEGKITFALGLIHKLWHRTRGRVFILCSGTADECARTVETVASGIPHRVEAWVDTSAKLKQTFGITESPAAVRLTWRGEIEARGMQPGKGKNAELQIELQ